MVRWRYSLVLATLLLLLLPPRVSCKGDDDDEEERNEEADDEEDDEDDDEDEDSNHERSSPVVAARRAPPHNEMGVSPKNLPVTRTSKKRPLECYVCAYKAETPLRACLDPTRFRVHTITCHSVDDKCFTTVISKGETGYEAVVRGCRSGCVGSPDTNCCELNRCNNQAFAMPTPKVLTAAAVSKVAKPGAPNVLYFVTLLLILQTVAKVAFV